VSILLEGGRICHSCPLIWSCPAAQDVWGSSPLIFQKSCSWGTGFLSTFASFLMCCSNDDLDLLAVLARWIWLRRNTLVFEGTFIHPNIVFKGAVDALDEFKKCHMQDPNVSIQEVDSCILLRE